MAHDIQAQENKEEQKETEPVKFSTAPKLRKVTNKKLKAKEISIKIKFLFLVS